MRRSMTWTGAIVIASLLAVSACGGDDDADDAGDPPAASPNSDSGEDASDGDAGPVADDGGPIGSGTATVADQSWTFENVSCVSLTDFALIDPSPSTSGDVTLEVRYDPQNGDDGLVDVRAADESFSWYGDGFDTGTSSVTISVVDDVVRVEGTVIDNFAPTVDKPMASIEVEVFC